MLVQFCRTSKYYRVTKCAATMTKREKKQVRVVLARENIRKAIDTCFDRRFPDLCTWISQMTVGFLPPFVGN